MCLCFQQYEHEFSLSQVVYKLYGVFHYSTAKVQPVTRSISKVSGSFLEVGSCHPCIFSFPGCYCHCHPHYTTMCKAGLPFLFMWFGQFILIKGLLYTTEEIAIILLESSILT